MFYKEACLAWYIALYHASVQKYIFLPCTSYFSTYYNINNLSAAYKCISLDIKTNTPLLELEIFLFDTTVKM